MPRPRLECAPKRAEPPAHSPPSPRAMRGIVIAIVLAAALAACGGPGQETLQVEHATATSKTSLDVAFDTEMGEAAADPSLYAITGPDDEPLEVIGAYTRDDGRTVSLATEPQRRETYALRIRGLKVDGAVAPTLSTRFMGSEVAAPVVAGAVALDSERVLVTFLDPDQGAAARMSDVALDAATYGVEPALRIKGAAFHRDGADRGRVILHTEPQRSGGYTLRAARATHQRGGGLVDPFNDTATWAGIAPDDSDPPRIVRTFAPSTDAVHVSFSEPVSDAAADPANYRITREDPEATEDEAPQAAIGVSLNEFGTQATVRIPPAEPGGAYALTAADIRDRSGNLLAKDGSSARFFAASSQGNDMSAPPSVAGVVSTGPHSVVVTFTEPVLGGPASAENPSHYRIHDQGQGLRAQAVLHVQEAELSASGTSVTLTTMAQAEILYAIEVANVVDQQGQQIMVPRFASAGTYQFLGTPAVHDPEVDDDSDDDGLPDVAEQAGWTVEVHNANGRVDRSQVTSDPHSPDTDGDGVPDLEERRYRTHPRRGDTDADGLSDDQELNEIYSDPADQDTDGDGLEDGLEFGFFRTSPILADTDGDQIDDAAEATQANRNPRAADLPRHDLEIGDVAVELVVDFEDTTAEGEVRSSTESYGTTLTETRANEMSSSSTETMEWYAEASLETTLEGSYPGGYSASATFTAEAGVGASGTYVQSQTSRQSSERTHEESLESNNETFRTETVTRTVTGATLVVPVTLRNVNDISFTMENVEITALIPDPRDRSQLRPIGTLFPPASASGVYNLGTIDSKLGPFKFETSDDDINPDLIDTLLANPSAIVLRVSNFDITDELGNHFAYQQQDVTERTAPVVIDFGDGRVERYWAATNIGRPIADTNGDGDVDDEDRRVVFDEAGNPVGITLRRILEDVVGLEPASATSDLMNSYEEDATGKLVRVRDAELADRDKQAWHVLTGDGLQADTGLDDVVLTRGSSAALVLVTDMDGDHVSRRLEYLHGTYDDEDVAADASVSAIDSDGDGVPDYDEIYLSYVVDVVGEVPYTVYSDPASADTDGDGLADLEEREVGTDARLVDTDGDGACDGPEVAGCPHDHFPLDPSRSGRPPLVLRLLLDEFDEDLNEARDTSGEGNHASFGGHVFHEDACGMPTPDRFGHNDRAFLFHPDGTECGMEESYAQITAPDLGLENEFTISLWLRHDGEPSHTSGFAHVGPSDEAWIRTTVDDGALTFSALPSGSSEYVTARTDALDLSEWGMYTFLARYDSGSGNTTLVIHRAVEVEGEVQVRQLASATFHGRLANEDQGAFTIGTTVHDQNLLPSGEEAFDGAIDEIHVFDGALSPTNITEIYGDPVPSP